MIYRSYGIIMFPNHIQNSICQNFICMHVMSTIMIMNKQTHCTIDLQTRSNSKSFIPHLSTNLTYNKKIDNFQIVQKIGLFTNWVLQRNLKLNASVVGLLSNNYIFLICFHMKGLNYEFTSITPQED
jgi:hypothetical protein